MASLNQVQLIGNVGRDPESRVLPSGVMVINFSVATTEKWKSRDGEKMEETSWHRCVAFDKTAEIIEEYVKKGDKLYIEGRLKYGSYEKDGVKHYTTDINVNRVQMLGSPKDRDDGDDRRREEPQRNSGSNGRGREMSGGSASYDRDERSPGQRARQEQPARRAPAASKPSSGFDDMDDDMPFLFNLNTASDTVGLSKSQHRIKHGPKALHILRAQKADF